MDWFLGFFDWLWCLLKGFVNFIMDLLADLFYYTIGLVIRLLPDTPFQFEPVEWGTIGSAVGYFIPIPKMAQHFTILLITIGLYYLVRHLLRLVKMVK